MSGMQWRCTGVGTSYPAFCMFSRTTSGRAIEANVLQQPPQWTNAIDKFKKNFKQILKISITRNFRFDNILYGRELSFRFASALHGNVEYLGEVNAGADRQLFEQLLLVHLLGHVVGRRLELRILCNTAK